MNEHELCHDDAAYLLGSLSAYERRRFEQHLAGCARCRRSVRDLAGVPALMKTVTTADLDMDPGPVPAAMLPGLVAAVHRRRRRMTLAAAAGSVAILVGAVALGEAIGSDESGPSGPAPALAAPMNQVGQKDLSAGVSVEGVRWGTRLTLTCSYTATGPYAGSALPVYALVVTDTHGETERVSTWRAVAGRETTVTAGTSWTPADITAVEVQTVSGDTALRLRR